MIKFQQDFPEALSFIKEFLDPNSSRPKFVFGTNHAAEEISTQIKINGFVDDLKPKNTFCNLPVIRSEELPKNALVVIVALMRPLSIQRTLQSLEVQHLHYVALMRFSSLKLSQPWFWSGFDDDFYEHNEFYGHFDECLADKESRKVFEKIINFRLTGDLKNLKDFKDQQAKQYFEPFLNLVDGESFVDIGGFDGQTALEFANHCPNYKKIYLFEPEKSNMSVAKKVCKKLRDVVFQPFGVSDRQEVLGIKVGGSTSQVVPKGKGDYDIEIRPLDYFFQCEKITFLKMDIEGAEKKALMGSQNIIKNQMPKLAICVYHQGDDFRLIYQLVTSLSENYRVFLRHYTEGIVETVMFFVPSDQGLV